MSYTRPYLKKHCSCCDHSFTQSSNANDKLRYILTNYRIQSLCQVKINLSFAVWWPGQRRNDASVVHFPSVRFKQPSPSALLVTTRCICIYRRRGFPDSQRDTRVSPPTVAGLAGSRCDRCITCPSSGSHTRFELPRRSATPASGRPAG